MGSLSGTTGDRGNEDVIEVWNDGEGVKQKGDFLGKRRHLTNKILHEGGTTIESHRGSMETGFGCGVPVEPLRDPLPG